MNTLILENGRYRAALSRLTFGTGELVDFSHREEYFALLDCYYFTFGGRSFDTARMYGNGISEAILGEWLHLRNIPRSEVFITSKGGFPPADDLHACRIDRANLEADLTQSLSDSGLSYFDLYLPHRDHASLPVSEIMDTLNAFADSGKVHFIGVSNWRHERIEEANRYAVAHHLLPLSVSQINFSLAETTPERLKDDTLVVMTKSEYDWYLAHRFPVMAFSSQAKGFFAKLGTDEAPTEKILARFMTEKNLARLERVKALSHALSASPAAVALAFLSCNPLPTSAIFRCRTLTQLKDSLSAASLSLTEEQIRALCTP